MVDLDRGHSATVGAEYSGSGGIKSLGLVDAGRWTGVSGCHGCGCLAGGGKHSCEQLSGLGPAGRVPLEGKCYTHQVVTANVAVDVYSVATPWLGIHQT